MRIGGIPFEMIGGLMVPKGYREINLVSPPIVPVAGAELLTNGNMETGDPPTGWLPGTGVTLDGVADERTGGAGAQSLAIIRAVGGPTAAVSNSGNIVTVAGQWVLASGWLKRIDATNLRIDIMNSAWGPDILGPLITSTSWVFSRATGRLSSTVTRFRCGMVTSADGQSGRFDDVSLKPLTFSSLLVYLGTRSQLPGTYTCKPTLTAGTQCGLTIGYKDENNFLQLYHDGTTAFLVMRKAGTYSTLASGAAAYAALQELKVVIAANGTDATLWYNGASIGTTTGIDPAVMGNHVYGFSTLASNTVGPVTTS